MATTLTLTVGKKAWLVKEPGFFHLRQIINGYNGLAAAEPKQQAELIMMIFRAVFGWRGRLIFWRMTSVQLQDFLTQLPAALGLEADSKAVKSPDAWGDVYAHLSCAMGGWTYDYIDQKMTLSRLKELHGYLKNHPPTHLLVAAYLNYEPPLSLAEKRRRFFDRFTQ
jgi:hypothetical protein